ncbi:MAG: allophanate hydrolase [Methylovulum sp.]|uniref:allophanate hydrolase n=1 Tax=Methylovulum sp. TaxID=1916980 RepID=UPI00261956C1|nr:allophanate hydrolase [Methylovulum sp.]MDD2723526.1 allophanate hydrolase [Methylovulum sp.]MDD5124516.1 allophanate hydrolase [Methylovulum sp.]
MNTSTEFLSLDIFTLRQAYLDGTTTVSAVIQQSLARVKDFQGHNIWISLQAESSLMAQAKELESLNPKDLPLYGIPFAVKDNIDCMGLPTTAACPGFSHLPSQSAFAVQCLIDAGAVLIGKTNMDQFATGLTGTRSPEPYGICKNAINPDYISGGSSSGSAVAVALNIVSFSLGTDTAGSGRVPAAFNNIVGLKPTRGLISCSGVVPACKSLDCVSIFSQTIAEAEYLFDIINAYDANDSYARNDRQGLDASIAATAQLRFGVPKPEQLNFFGDPESEALFAQTIVTLQTLGEVVEIDFQPFLEAAALLYEGPWIAERYAGIRPFIEAHPEQLHPVIMDVLSAEKDKNAIAAFDALHRLQQLKRQTTTLLQGLSCIAVPTAPRIYRIAEVLADPIRLNSNLGYYTNYMNLLDLSALAIPAGFYSNQLPFGITLFSTALADARLLAIAKRFAANGQTETITPSNSRYQRIAVCGAHMQGLPLNPQLLDLGARFYATTRTAANYQLYALAIAPPERPGLVRDESQGQSIELEIWELPKENWAKFISNIKSPLCIGSVEMEDGRWEYGFLCEPYPLGKSVAITEFGGWRNYLKDKA